MSHPPQSCLAMMFLEKLCAEAFLYRPSRTPATDLRHSYILLIWPKTLLARSELHELNLAAYKAPFLGKLI